MVFSKIFFEQKLENTLQLAKEQTNDNRYRKRAAFFRLEKYANNFLQGQTDVRLIIMYGLRGIGKTIMLLQLYQRLIDKGVPKENILYISADQLRLQEKENPIYNTIISFLKEIHNTEIEGLNKKIFIFVDEAHSDANWSITAKAIYDSTKNIFLVMTGSSAISLNINTDTARRSFKEPIFPLNFSEYNIIRNDIYPPRGTADALKESILLFNPPAITALNSIQTSLESEFKNKKKDINEELHYFLKFGGFGFSFTSTEGIIYRRLLDVMGRIIDQDLPLVYDFEQRTRQDIWRILGHLAKKAPGETSHTKICKSLNLSSPTLVKNIFDALEKTQLLLEVKPFPKGTASKAGYPFKYYFSSPTLLTAVQYFNGKISLSDSDMALVWETAVADVLFKITKTSGAPLTLLYDTTKTGNADFLIQNSLSGKIVPVEVGMNKSNSQILNAMDEYKAKHGIVVTNCKNVEVEENVLRIPFWLFMYS